MLDKVDYSTIDLIMANFKLLDVNNDKVLDVNDIKYAQKHHIKHLSDNVDVFKEGRRIKAKQKKEKRSARSQRGPRITLDSFADLDGDEGGGGAHPGPPLHVMSAPGGVPSDSLGKALDALEADAATADAPGGATADAAATATRAGTGAGAGTGTGPDVGVALGAGAGRATPRRSVSYSGRATVRASALPQPVPQRGTPNIFGDVAKTTTRTDTKTDTTKLTSEAASAPSTRKHAATAEPRDTEQEGKTTTV